METKPTANKQVLKELNSQLKKLQDDLQVANKLEGVDEYISVKLQDTQARFERIRSQGERDKAVGKFLLEINITAKAAAVFVPLSVSSSKKPTGFIYQIEGTAAGAIASAEVKCRGEDITQITTGTLLYAKIPAGKTALFRIQATVRGKLAKTYKVIITRINYKLAVTDARYQQYLKEIASDDVKLT